MEKYNNLNGTIDIIMKNIEKYKDSRAQIKFTFLFKSIQIDRVFGSNELSKLFIIDAPMQTV